MMHPGAERLLLFHVVASGRCWVSAEGGERIWANAGDVIVLPYGDAFVVGGEDPDEPTSARTVVPPPPWNGMLTLRYGGGGSQTDIVCGCLYSEDPLFAPELRAFPPVFVVRTTDGPVRSWFDASIAYALEQAAGGRGIRRTKLPEMLIIEVLRLYLSTAPGADRGWLAAVRDPVLAPALKVIHGQAGRRWDRRGSGQEDGGVAVNARRSLPRSTRAVPDPLRQRVAHARRSGPARHHGNDRGRDSEVR